MAISGSVIITLASTREKGAYQVWDLEECDVELYPT